MSQNTEEQRTASDTKRIVIPQKFVPVIMCEDNNYIKNLNKDMEEGLKYIYETQKFPITGDMICFNGFDPQKITSRVFLPNPVIPMIYLFTPFWSKEDEIEMIYNGLMDQKYDGEDFDTESDEEYKNEIKYGIKDYYRQLDIYRAQKKILEV